MDRRRAFRWGLSAERRAALALRLSGHRILARRLKTPLGELDLVVRRGRRLAIVEVKARPDLGTAAEALRPAQRRRLERAAEWYLGSRPALAALTLGFDLVLVAPGRWPRHVRDAWRRGLG